MSRDESSTPARSADFDSANHVADVLLHVSDRIRAAEVDGILFCYPEGDRLRFGLIGSLFFADAHVMRRLGQEALRRADLLELGEARDKALTARLEDAEGGAA